MGNKSGIAALGTPQTALTIAAGPAAAGPDDYPTFRALGTADLPTGIPTANMADPYNTDYLALNTLGSAIKGFLPGNVIYIASNTAVTLTSQFIYYMAMYVPKPVTLTGLITFMSGTAVYTGNNYNGVGLYTINTGTGLLTQVAASTNAPTLWTAPQGKLVIPFSATYNAAIGVYYVALMWSASATTTAPKIMGQFPSNIVPGMDFANSIRLQMNSSAATVLPATVLSSAIVTGQNNILYSYLY